MTLRVIHLFAVILLGCCSSPLESSSMLAFKRAVMNSGKVQMTAQPQMRSGKEDNLSNRFVLQPFALEVFQTLNLLFL